MKITIIGSSHGVPEANRKCACTMVEVGGNVYFFDMGTPGIEPMRNRGMDIRDVRAVFITHVHGDHINGLIPFVDLITWYFKDADPEIFLPIPEAGEIIDRWLSFTLNGCEKAIRYREVQPGLLFDDGCLKVTAIPTQHCKKSYAYLLEAEGKRVLLTGDLKRPGEDFPAVSGPLDLVVCESAHFPAMEYLPIFEKMDIKKVCVTHYFTPFVPSVMELLKTMEDRGVAAVLGTDDLEFRI